ncbi:tellurite-resistance/dicarboxylate transporter family protein [Aspergillus foveolatus]|uniref:tellurite-resistance/dicarboxylate transporter family protein n=1 Tax=Aspergillus foveolatus TaxID=210207 RepID=UPI003CCD9BEA
MEKRLSLRQQLSQATWGWYSASMAAGGIAVLLYNTPHQFTGLKTIGKVAYIFNIVLFVGISLCMGARFCSSPSSLKESVRDPSETHFIATCPLAVATIILGASSYGTDACGPWLLGALHAVFWVYVAVSVVQAIVHNWYLYHRHMASQQPMAIVRCLPSFPAMLSGTIAAGLASDQPAGRAVPMIVAGTTLQGFGFVMTLFVYSEYFYRLNKDGLPDLHDRPEMFIAVGPWSFTALALIGMAEAAVEKVPAGYIVSSATETAVAVATGQIALVLASLVAIFLWMLALFCLCIAILSMLAPCRALGGDGGVPMSLAYWSMVFPNTGFVIATIRIGQVLQSESVLWVASAMTIVQVGTWLGVGLATMWKIVHAFLYQ